MNGGRGLVLFGDVVGSRRDPTGAGEWLRGLAGRLDAVYGDARLAPFGFTQGDELQGLLATTADPLAAVLVAGLDEAARPMRWVAVAGEVAAGRGPATERSGPAFILARDSIEQMRRQRDVLQLVSGDPRADSLLADLAPLLGDLIRELTPRQRTIARMALVDGLRQADVAEKLNVSRATISVTYGRGRVRSIQRLVDATKAIFREGVAAAAESAAVVAAAVASAEPAVAVAAEGATDTATESVAAAKGGPDTSAESDAATAEPTAAEPAAAGPADS